MAYHEDEGKKKHPHPQKKQDIVFLTLKISKMLQGSMPPAPPQHLTPMLLKESNPQQLHTILDQPQS